MSRHLATVKSQSLRYRSAKLHSARRFFDCKTQQGAIPEIHDRLRLVRADEAIIFVSPAPSTTP